MEERCDKTSPCKWEVGGLQQNGIQLIFIPVAFTRAARLFCLDSMGIFSIGRLGRFRCRPSGARSTVYAAHFRCQSQRGSHTKHTLLGSFDTLAKPKDTNRKQKQIKIS